MNYPSIHHLACWNSTADGKLKLKDIMLIKDNGCFKNHLLHGEISLKPEEENMY
jgi:hypothetical protein